MTNRHLVRVTGLALAATFAVVGVVFLFTPNGVLAAFNWAGRALGLPESPTDAFTLYLALAVAYMYVVMVLAWQMARHPDSRAYPWVLVQAKAASALVCLALFAVQEQHLIYLVNAIVDGGIAAFVWWVALRPSAQGHGGGRRAAGTRRPAGRDAGAAEPRR